MFEDALMTMAMYTLIMRALSIIRCLIYDTKASIILSAICVFPNYHHHSQHLSPSPRTTNITYSVALMID